jgi:hypothetical protein
MCLNKAERVVIMTILKQLALGIFLILGASVVQAEEQTSEIEPFTQAELEQVLAPIALYPDTVLSHILIAATYPLEVVQAERWTLSNPDITGSDAVEAVKDENWDPSIKALVAFPQVLKRLSENLDWTQKLGDAFLQDEEKLLASVQTLRVRAYEAGNLDKMDKVSVIHEDESIIIEPVEREVVYVPYYDTRVVYGPWYWSHYPPVYWNSPYYASHYGGHHASPFYWGPSVNVSFGFFFSSFHWHNHHVVRIPYHHYRPHHYYDRHQIANHQHARRWSHNPTHRRGVSYRSVTVSNRYNSTRPSQAEIKTHRNTRNYSSNEKKSDRKADRVLDRRNNSSKNKKQIRSDKRNTRIATPDRIKKELSDGRISVKERKSRPNNYNTVNKAKKSVKQSRSEIQPRSKTSTKQPRVKTDSTKSNRSKEQKERTSYQQIPAKQQSQRQSNTRETSSRSSPQTSERSSSRNSSYGRSKNSSSNSNRSERSRERGDKRH